MVEKSGVEKSRVEMSGVEKSRVGKFMVEKSGVEMPFNDRLLFANLLWAILTSDEQSVCSKYKTVKLKNVSFFQVRWGDAYEGQGEQFYDYNHSGPKIARR